MAVLYCIYSGLDFNGCSHPAQNATYYTLHYTLAPTVSLLHSLPFKMPFFRLSEHTDAWVEGNCDLHWWSWGKNVLCVVSDKHICESLLPTVAFKSAGSPLDDAIRSVCRHTCCVRHRLLLDVSLWHYAQNPSLWRRPWLVTLYHCVNSFPAAEWTVFCASCSC